MPVKIKWNDDRVSGTAVALLLIIRTRLSKGKTIGLIQAALGEYRGDLDAYKAEYTKRDMDAAKETGPLKNAQHIEYYKKLTGDVERLMAKMEKNRRQFNSLVELDNFLVFTLQSFD